MSALVQPRAATLDIVTALVALAAYVGAKLHLYSNDFTPTPDSVIGDFTECVYSGYAAKVITWSAAFYDETGQAVSSGGESLFIQTGATPDLCYGAYLTDAASAVLLGSGRLDAPVPFSFSVQNDALALSIKLGLNVGTLIRDLGP